MKPTIIGILGKPLAGKDTVAHTLVDRNPEVADIISISTVLSEVKAQGEAHRFWPLLHEAIAIAEAGGIVPGEPVNQCMEQLIAEQLEAGKTQIIWIGGPRNIEELEWLDTWAKTHNMRELFMNIDIPDEEAYRRLDGRGNGRADDRVDILPVRLEKFRDITLPVIDILKKEGRIMEIDGVGRKEAVAHRAVEALGRHLDPEISLPLRARR